MISKKTIEIDHRNQQILRLAERLEAKKLKRLLTLEGYTFQISFYGVALDKDTGESAYRRIEVFIDARPTEETFMQLREFFAEFIPPKVYTILSYKQSVRDLEVRGEFE